jgi:hypothetical protein
MALSLSWTGWFALVWLFCSRATIRNVTIVVSVLMSSCQVSMLPMTR